MRSFQGQVLFRKVEGIDVGRLSQERLHRINYGFGDLEHLTASEVMAAQCTTSAAPVEVSSAAFARFPFKLYRRELLVQAQLHAIYKRCDAAIASCEAMLHDLELH